MKNVIDEFIKRLTDVLIYKNNNGMNFCIDIPFIIAPLKQNLSQEKYKDFIDSLSNYDYLISYEHDEDNEYINDSIDIDFYQEYQNEQENFSYKIEFINNDRYLGYCECKQEGEGYRKDKDCCGYKCDWTAPSFSMEKTIFLGKNSWNGSQHDYWDFEDNFYNINVELDKEKKEKERNDRIKYINNQIEKLQNELTKLK